MKNIIRILMVLLTLILIAIAAAYIFLRSQKPQYNGSLKLKGLKQRVEIFFDNYGVPHIYGENAEDTYFALGYVHAQDRLFQMEMMRRASAGRLSEILGSKLLDVDKFFRMLGFAKRAEESEKKFLNDTTLSYRKTALAYLAGINSYIENGKIPLEFRLVGVPKEKYTPKDMYLVVDYMSFIFQMAFKTDPLMSKIKQKLGDNYLKDLALDYVPGSNNSLTTTINYLNKKTEKNYFSFAELENKLPVPLWLGSNSWAVSPQKSVSGKVLFANDTHVGYGQPAVWYEAHLEYPGYSFYGSFLSGFPFAPIGHTRRLAWGLTIFENDDLDFFKEQTDSLHPDEIFFVDHWEKLEMRKEVIKIKDTSDVEITIRSSHHGPVCTDVIKDFSDVTNEPVTASWTFLKSPSDLFLATYQMNHSENIDDMRHAVSQIAAPGLNVIYGDVEGNIAWWTAAKLVRRPPNVNPKLLLDGSNGNDEWLGWYDFKDNPQSENPSCGFVCSANNQPDTLAGILYPGYYTPADRFNRISEVLGENKKFVLSDMQKLQNNVVSNAEKINAKKIISILSEPEKTKTENHKKVSGILKSWNGSNGLDDVAPTIYYKLLYHILFNAMADEMGEKDFNRFLITHVQKNSVAPLFENNNSVWWDNIKTDSVKETREQIFNLSFDQTIGELEKQLGENPAEWKWKKVHTLEHVHPVGTKKPLNNFFNVGPFPIGGGNETLNQEGFDLNGTGIYKVKFGPALRRVIDFADPENGQSISPTGQSGNVMSKHYSDQAKMFVNGETRKEMMNRKEIEEKCRDKLTLQPQ